MEINYQGPVLKSFKGAKDRYKEWIEVLPKSCFFVAVKTFDPTVGTPDLVKGYFPVCVISQEDAHRAFDLANAGIYVIRN